MTNFLTEVTDAARDVAISNRNVQRTNLNFQAINSKLSEHTKTLAAVTPVIANNTIPSNPTSVSGTNGGKVVDNVLLDTVTVQYTSPSPIGSFGGVFLVAKNYNGSSTLVKVGEDTFHGAAGAIQSFVTVLQRTNEAVTFFVVPKTASEVTPTDWTTSPSFALTLNGLVSAPPAPTFTETLTATPTGYEFIFNQVVAAGTVIDSYNVYRNTSFTSSGAIVIRTYKHGQTNAGSPITVQDVSPDGVPYYYYVSAVNTSGLESSLAAAQAGTVFATIPLTMKGAPVVAAPLIPSNALTNGGALGQWTAGLAVALPGVVDFDVQSTGGIIDILLWASTGGTGPNGYLLRFDARSGHVAGQLLKITNGTWANIGTAKAANNSAKLTGWHSITARVTGQGQFDIFVDGIWETTVIDTTFTLTGATYYGYEVTAGSTLAPSALIQKTVDHLPDGVTYGRTQQLAGNLIPDSDFEFGTTYWSTPPHFTIVPGGGQHGGNAVKMDWNAAFMQSPSIPATAGMTYVLSALVDQTALTSALGVRSIFLQVNFLNISSAVIQQSFVSFDVQNNIITQTLGTGIVVNNYSTFVARIAMSCVAPAGTVSMQVLSPQAGGSATAGTLLFSAPQLEVGAVPSPYASRIQDQTTGYLKAGSAAIDLASGIHLNKTVDNVADGSTRFGQTAGGLTYRPTSNPLTATDAGANATVSIAAFTMRCTGHTDISVSSGSITALSYSTLYYIYYDDATLAGGAATFNATTTKETAINGSGRFFVGSIVTPAATGAATVGNNDGGVGAQGGGTSVFLFGAVTVVNTVPTGITVTNANNCFDGNTSTFAKINKNTLSGVEDASFTVISMTPSSAPWQSLTLKVRTAVPTNGGTNNSMTVSYSLDGGTTFTTIFTTTGTRALTLDSVSLPLTQNLAQLRVKVDCNVAVGNAFAAEIDLYEAWVIGVL